MHHPYVRLGLKITAVVVLISLPIVAYFVYKHFTALPPAITLATGPKNGLYRGLSVNLAAELEKSLPIQVHTQHTIYPVPLVYIGERAVSLKPSGGVLSDVAPTLLAMMGLDQPAEMSGTNLMTFSE